MGRSINDVKTGTHTRQTGERERKHCGGRLTVCQCDAHSASLIKSIWRRRRVVVRSHEHNLITINLSSCVSVCVLLVIVISSLVPFLMRCVCLPGCNLSPLTVLFSHDDVATLACVWSRRERNKTTTTKLAHFLSRPLVCWLASGFRIGVTSSWKRNDASTEQPASQPTFATCFRIMSRVTLVLATFMLRPDLIGANCCCWRRRRPE